MKEMKLTPGKHGGNIRKTNDDTITTTNITNCWTTLQTIADMPGLLHALVETSIPTQKHKAIRAQARTLNMELVLTDPDPEMTNGGGGSAFWRSPRVWSEN